MDCAGMPEQNTGRKMRGRKGEEKTSFSGRFSPMFLPIIFLPEPSSACFYRRSGRKTLAEKCAGRKMKRKEHDTPARIQVPMFLLSLIIQTGPFLILADESVPGSVGRMARKAQSGISQSVLPGHAPSRSQKG
jgi:hypothetical protein